MTNCPICGTANQEGSRFCSACGATLPTSTGIRCPMCGKMNPLGNVFCDHCSARLVPLTADSLRREQEPPSKEAEKPQIKPFSLPTIPLEEKPAAEEEDWLAGLRDVMGEEAETGAAAEEIAPMGLPDWLAGIQAEEEAAPPEAGRPDWLAGPTEEEGPLEAAAPEVGLPDWLAGVQAEEEAAPAFTAPIELGEPTSGLPDWLLETLAAPAEAAELPAVPAAEVPDWLAEVQPAAGAEAAPSPLSGLPDWLVGVESAAPPTPPAEVPFTAPLEAAGIPDWLAEAAPPVPATGEISLDWLTDLAKAEEKITPPPAAPRVPAVPPPEAEGLVRGEIPAWLEALRPKTEAEAAAEEPPESAGLLEGIRGTLIPSNIVDMPGDAKPLVPGAPSAAAIARSQLLQELLGRPVSPPLEIQEDRGRRFPLWLRLGIALALVAAIVIPMFLPIPLFGVPAMPAADDLFNVIEQHVTADTPVLVAFEYGPADADEMDWVTLPILRHILQRGGRLIVVSTQPEGTAMAERVLARLLPDAATREARAANLGYQPGQVAGIQNLLTNLSGRLEVHSGLPAAESAAMSGVSNAGDAAIVLILTARADDLRCWIEQTSAIYPETPLLAGVSARVETTALPYLSSQAGQLEGSIAGLVGAVTYEKKLGGGELPNLERFYLPSLGAVQLAVAAILLIGMLGYLLRPGGTKA